MPSPTHKIKSVDKKNNRSLLIVLKWILVAVIVLFVLFLATSPLRGKAANNYIGLGDELLSQKKYISAEVEYKKALALKGNNAVAKDHLNLAEKAMGNIAEFERFFDLPQFAGLKEKYDSATAVPSNQSDAVKLSKKLVSEGEYQLAIIPAKTALEMDNEYRDAWLYLGIANLKTAQLTELKQEVQNQYLNEAKQSFNKVLQLDPENPTAKELIAKI